MAALELGAGFGVERISAQFEFVCIITEDKYGDEWNKNILIRASQLRGAKEGGRMGKKASRCRALWIFLKLNGAPTRTRTADLLITNQLLYQLSYRGIDGPFNAITKIAQEAFMLLLQVLQLCYIQIEIK